MSETLNSFEQHNDIKEDSDSPEAQTQQVEQKSEIKAENIDVGKTREAIKNIHETDADQLNEPAQSASRIINVPLPNLQPVVDTIAKTWSSIRQNLTPSQKAFSKVIHNPLVSNVSEFTAKTLARPYAILSGGVVAVAGSGAYLYLTKHFNYRYNYFVPIMLFGIGLVVGLVVELFYKSVGTVRKK